MSAPPERYRWTKMANGNLADVVAIADEVHPALPERPEVFTEKHHLFPDGGFVLEARHTIVGYALSHSWPLDEIAPIDAFLGTVPASADCLYLHDIAILTKARGNGSAQSVIQLLKGVASTKGLRRLALVSVYGTNGLWSRFGFRERTNPTMVDKLSTYGRGACYMTMDL